MELTYKIYRNATVMPTIKCDLHNFIGGVYCNGEYIKESHVYTPAPFIRAKKYIDRIAVYGGILFGHYGHFLLESLQRFWFIKGKQYPIVWTLGESLVSWQYEILKILDADCDNLFIKEPTCFRELIVPFPGFIYKNRFIGKHFFSRQHASTLAVYKPTAIITGKKTYISRTKLSKDVGGFDNEFEIESLVKTKGWNIFHPQDFTVNEQLKEISSSEIVFGIECSAFHSLILLNNPSTLFFTMGRENYNVENYNLIATMSNLKYKTFIINSIITKKGQLRSFYRYNIDIKQVESIIEQIEYLPNIDCNKDSHNYHIESISFEEMNKILLKNNINATPVENIFYQYMISKKLNDKESILLLEKILSCDDVQATMIFEYVKFCIEYDLKVNIIKLIERAISKQIHWSLSLRINASDRCKKKGKFEIAEKLITDAIRLHPDRGAAYQRMALLLDAKKLRAEALEYARKAVEIEPNELGFKVTLSNLLRWTRKSSEAIALMEGELLSNPKWGEPYRQLSYIERDKGNIDKAIELARKSLEVSPNHLWYGDYLASLLRKKGDYNEVEFIAKNALSVNEKQTWAYMQLSYVDEDLSQLKEAIDHMQQAIKFDPTNAAFTKRLAALQEKDKVAIQNASDPVAPLGVKLENKSGDNSMCSGSCVKFVGSSLTPSEIHGKKVIEVGSRFVNGSVRWAVEQHNPELYLGIDMFAGPCVDEVCTIEDTFTRFEPESFDIVISTELLDHVMDFRLSINALKRLCKKDGIIIITTRSKGFPLHGYPYDFWRFEKEDMHNLFADYKIEKCIDDPTKSPGVFLKAIKSTSEQSIDINGYQLYNILCDKKMACDLEALSKMITNGKFMKQEPRISFFENFTELYDFGARRNTDKTTHNYLPKYELFLQKLKEEKFTFLELGVLNGSSVMMWHDYFKFADIVGVDKTVSCKNFIKERLDIKILDLGDIDTYKELVKLEPKIIVDDASHLWGHQLIAFFQLFPSLPSGGVYIMEDIQTSFDPLKAKYCNNIIISPFDMLQKLAEAVASNCAPDRIPHNYQVLLDSIAKHVDMISFIHGSCIIIKK